MKKIERADLVSLGATDRALDFYDSTDPCVITQDSSGRFHADIGGDQCTYRTAADLLRDLDAMAENEEQEATPMTYAEFRDDILHFLDLDNRSIIFHILDMDTGTFIGSGLIDSEDGLYDSDPFIEAELDYAETEFAITNVSSYLLGSGEAEHADHADVEFLTERMRTYGRFFDRLIQEEADLLCSLDDFTLENSQYDPDDDWDDNDADLDD